MKKVEQKPEEIICCPYFDAGSKVCTQNDCYRMLGFECRYSNRNKKNRK